MTASFRNEYALDPPLSHFNPWRYISSVDFITSAAMLGTKKTEDVELLPFSRVTVVHMQWLNIPEVMCFQGGICV